MSGAARPGLPAASAPPRKALCPAAVILGAVTAFVACCVAGRIAARHNTYKWFTRFHSYLGPETLYYPTASQLRSLARARLDPDRVAVVVGGNSILQGVGQRATHLWTKELQKLLGDDYRVLNLAVVGARPSEFGGVAAEILAADYKKLIYVTDLGSSTSSGHPDGHTYRYLFWDAYFKGMLLPDPARQQRLAELEAERRKEGNEFTEELAGRRLDARLFFQDLWTTCAYRKLNTIWTPLLPCKPFTTPRCKLPDTGMPLPEELRRRALEDPVSLEIVRGVATNIRNRVYGSPVPPGPRDALRSSVEQSVLIQGELACFPEAVRSHTLLLVLYDNPTVIERLPADLQVDYHWALTRAAALLQEAGFAALNVGGDFVAEDFADRCHLTEKGGRTLARRVAPKIRAMAKRLGYLGQEEKP